MWSSHEKLGKSEARGSRIRWEVMDVVIKKCPIGNKRLQTRCILYGDTMKIESDDRN